METNNNIIDGLPGTILEEILAKLPIKNITISKLVCKKWKTQVESMIFRNLFVSMHQKSSCSWSLLRRYSHYRQKNTIEEILGLYGCERWGLTRSLGYYISLPILDSGTEITSFIVKSTASGLLLISLGEKYFVGNPVLQQWVKIPPCTLSLRNYFFSEKFGLATHVDDKGIVLDNKVVLVVTRFKKATTLALQIYSSDTGEWTCMNICCPCLIPWSSPGYLEPISLNGVLHWVLPGEDDYDDDAGGLVAIDVYNNASHGAANHCWVIPFPKKNFGFHRLDGYKIWSRRACTTSGGFIVYINMVYENVMNVWRLENDYYTNDTGEYWQFSWEIDLAYVDYGVGSIPMAMHPFDTNIVYLWNLNKNCLVSINLREQKSMMLHKESEEDSDGCIISSLEKCKRYMYETFETRLFEDTERGLFYSPQFLPSFWMDSVPRPPFALCVCCGR